MASVAISFRLASFVALATLAATLAAGAQPLRAHAQLETSDPISGSPLEALPQVLSLLFSEPIVAGSANFSLTGPAGETVALANTVLSADGRSVQLSVETNQAAAGTFSLRWTVTSATDGHRSSGLIIFSAGTGRGPPEAFLSTSSRAAWWEIGAEAVFLLALASLAALLLLRMDGSGSRAVALFAAGLVAGIAAIESAIEADSLLSSSQAGQIRLAAGALALVAAAAAAWRARFGAAAGWVCWVAAVIAVAASGHAAGADRPAIAIVVTAVHSLIALGWAGAAVAIAWEVRHGDPLALMRRLARIGLGGLLLLIGAGVAASALYLPGDRAVTTSLYGRTLLLKLLLVILVLALAAANRWVVGPWLNRRDGADGQSRAILAAEAGTLALVIIFAAALSATSPPADKGLVNVAPRATAVDQAAAAGDLRIGVSGQIAGMPEDRLIVTITDAAGGAPTAVQRVILTTMYRADPGAPADVGERFDAEGLADGRFAFPAVHLGRSGLWEIDVIVRRAGSTDLSAPFLIDTASWERASPRLEAAAWRWPAVPLDAWGLIVLAALVPLVAIWAMYRYGPLAPLSGAVIMIAVAMIATGFGIQALQRTSAQTDGHELTMPSDADPVAAGGNWATYCLTCHGESGRGIDSSDPLHQHGARADLTDRDSRQLSDGDLYWLITNGIGGTQMPAYGNALTEQERWDLVAYVRGLQAQEL